MDGQTLQDAVRDIRSAAQEVGALVISAIPGGRRMADLVAVERTEFLELIRHLSPKIIYLDEVRFEAATVLASFVDEEGEDSADDPDIRRAAKRWKQHNGELCQFIAVVVSDGIHHGYDEQIDWLDELDEVAAELRERREERAAAESEAQQQRNDEEYRLERERQAREDLALVRANATILKTDPRFEQSLTKAKRKQLASLLFPGLPGTMLMKIVDHTVPMEWLEAKDN